MEIKFVVESTNGKVWTAVCADPVLEAEGPDILSASKSMAAKIEKWFVETFNTTRTVAVAIPLIKATVKANVSVRAEKPLDEFETSATTVIPRTPPKPPLLAEKIVKGPCAYISDGKGLLPVGACEACSDDPSDTPGIIVDDDNTCGGEFEKCQYYKPGGSRIGSIDEPAESYDDSDMDEYGSDVDAYK